MAAVGDRPPVGVPQQLSVGRGMPLLAVLARYNSDPNRSAADELLLRAIGDEEFPVQGSAAEQCWCSSPQEWRRGDQSQDPAFRYSARDIGDIELDEIPGLLESVLVVTDGNPLLFGAQMFSVGELESSKSVGFRQGQRRVGLVIPVEVFFDAQRSVGLNVAWRHEQGCELRDHGAGA